MGGKTQAFILTAAAIWVSEGCYERGRVPSPHVPTLSMLQLIFGNTPFLLATILDSAAKILRAM
jgi:hypothetical protein